MNYAGPLEYAARWWLAARAGCFQNNYRGMAMYAVIVTGGRQYRVAQGETIRVDKLAGDVGSEIKLDQVLMVGEGDGVTLGVPLVSGALVTAKVVSHGRADKIRIVKFRRRKHHRKEMGHRQHYTEIEIVGITGASEKKRAAKAEKTAEE
jgi:large subunit ribosomal protein L21